jgi:hypothetical protein
MDGVAAGHHYIFQQDGVPAHNSNATQDWCRENLPEFWLKEMYGAFVNKMLTKPPIILPPPW